MFKVYSIIVLRENATIKRTVLPKVVKQNDVSHYFWKKLSKLDVSQNTRKKQRISIEVFFSKTTIPSDLNPENWFWRLISPHICVLLGRLFSKTIGFTHKWTCINHVNFMQIESKLRPIS